MSWVALGFKSVSDEEPSVRVSKDSRKSAEFVAQQLNNRYEFVEVLSPEGGSVFSAFWGGAKK